VDRSAPWECARATAALLTLLNIVANCLVLPRSLKALAPDYLKKLTVLLKQALLEMKESPGIMRCFRHLCICLHERVSE
jgi:hypothetical protein